MRLSKSRAFVATIKPHRRRNLRRPLLPLLVKSLVMPDSAPAIRADSLAVVRGGRRVFSDLSLAAHCGEWLRVQGANGAGKTTLLETLAGLREPDQGAVFWRGRDIAADPDEYRACLLFVGHKNALKDQLTAAENLRFAADLRGDDPAAGRIEDALARLQVDPDRPCGALSRGQRRRASLARLAVCAAALWILDEPLAALDAAARRAVGELLDDHLAQGGIAAVSTHEPIDARAAPREVALAH